MPQPPQLPPVRQAADAPGRRRLRPAARAGSSLPAWAYASAKTAPPPIHQAPLAPASAQPSNEPDLFDPTTLHADAESFAPAPARRRIWTVADLVTEVRTHIEDTWPDLWVHGEISNLRTAPSGHLYFTLKDGESQLPAVLFRRQAQLLRFSPEDGLEVLLRGKVSVYEQRGQMQLIAEHLEPVGAGSLQIAFEQLKARLDAEGLFLAERKRALPAYPRCVGIVTSPSGAVIRDFLNVAARRHAALDILLYPAVVQGASAAAEIAAGIAYFNRERNVDLIVIARGGGSLEDLAPFNTESLARAIAASTLPVVSAIGHETDFTIADFVADLRAPTPSAAAELITAAQHRVEEQVAALGGRLTRACRYQLILARQRLGAQSIAAARARLSESFNRRSQRLDTLRFRMEAALRSQLHATATRVAHCSVDAALARLRTGLADRAHTVDRLRFHLHQAHTQQLRTAGEHLQTSTAALLRLDPAARLRQQARAVATLRSRLQQAQFQQLRTEGDRLRAAYAALLRQHPAARLRLLHSRWSSLDARLARLALAQLQPATNRHASLARQIHNLSPLTVLSRGYALVFDAQGNLLKRAADTSPGDTLTVKLREGQLQTRVEAKPE